MFNTLYPSYLKLQGVADVRSPPIIESVYIQGDELTGRLPATPSSLGMDNLSVVRHFTANPLKLITD